MWTVGISKASWETLPSLAVHTLGVWGALDVADSYQAFITVGIIRAAGVLNTEMVVALVAIVTVGVGVTAWLASVVREVTPETSGVWVVCYITHFIISVAHAVAGAVVGDGVAVAADSIALVPGWALGIGRAFVGVTDIVMTNLITVVKTSGQQEKTC